MQSLPDSETCEKIGEVLNKIHTAHKTYAEAAEGLAELATEVTPQQYTMLLTAAVMPTIQIIVPGELLSPLTAPPPPQSPALMTLGRSEIIKYTKLKVLPNPDATALTTCDENSATRVLAAAVYSTLEHLFFDDTLSRIDISTAFHCNVSQLTKAITGVDYKGGPHHYKSKEATKRPSETTETLVPQKERQHQHTPLNQKLCKQPAQLYKKICCQVQVQATAIYLKVYQSKGHTFTYII